jgi:hypothetical protein
VWRASDAETNDGVMSGAAAADSLLMRSPLRRELVRTQIKSWGLDN